MISQFSEKIRSLFSKSNGASKTALAFGGTVILTSVVVTAAIVGVRQLGALESFELQAYDYLMRSRPKEQPDDRVVVVEISEQDIRQQNEFPMSDATIAKLLQKLEQYQARAIGIDILRDVPIGQGRQDLVKVLTNNDNIIAACKLSSESEPGTPAAPGVPEERVGFADMPFDRDNKIRRNILVSTPTKPTVPVEKPHLCNFDSPENQILSLAFNTALLYLQSEKIEPEQTDAGDLKLGSAVFKRLESNAGGYRNISAEDYQMMINYRSGGQPAKQVPLTQVLQGKVDKALLRDRLVLVGYTATTANDDFGTPYSAGGQDRVEMPGVVIHAHIASQILSAVWNQRPLIWYWPLWSEVLWIFGWSVVGGTIGWKIHRPWLFALTAGAAIVILYGSSYTLFLQAGWIPIVPSALAVVVTAASVVLIDRYSQAVTDVVKKLFRIEIQIDESQKAKEVAEIIETDSFQGLQEKAKELRNRRHNTTTTDIPPSPEIPPSPIE
ncbi:MAG TPA: transmembrane sensor domain protein, partial [Cyanobacteria bacterium UBA8803]|nr:transmembrane sensor domain protein [Cyanobacteria bacterium UBA8803]